MYCSNYRHALAIPEPPCNFIVSNDKLQVAHFQITSYLTILSIHRITIVVNGNFVYTIKKEGATSVSTDELPVYIRREGHPMHQLLHL